MLGKDFLGEGAREHLHLFEGFQLCYCLQILPMWGCLALVKLKSHDVSIL